MKRCWAIGVLLVSLACFGRTWTDLQGQPLEADVIRVNGNRTVALKTDQGNVLTVPFDCFQSNDVAYLDWRLALPFDLHPLGWGKMNTLFGISLWSDLSLWDDDPATVAQRLQLKQESKTEFMENYRSYPLGGQFVLGEPVNTIALYGDEAGVDSLSFIFANMGDLPPVQDEIEKVMVTREMVGNITRCGEVLCERISNVLGEPERDSLGSGILREKVWRWDWNGQAILLSIQKEKYVALRMMPVERVDQAGRAGKLKEDELVARMASCVEQASNGDVWIRNIPMVDQGPKGYCVPATWERYLRYLDIPADMYLLALAAQTKAGGGTHARNIIEATKSLISSHGHKLKEESTRLSIDEVARYIDRGLPVIWMLWSSAKFQALVTHHTAKRSGAVSGELDLESIDEADRLQGGHACMIIGYNRVADELAISDSWGAAYSIRWVPAEAARKVSQGTLLVIRW